MIDDTRSFFTIRIWRCMSSFRMWPTLVQHPIVSGRNIYISGLSVSCATSLYSGLPSDMPLTKSRYWLLLLLVCPPCFRFCVDNTHLRYHTASLIGTVFYMSSFSHDIDSTTWYAVYFSKASVDFSHPLISPLTFSLQMSNHNFRRPRRNQGIGLYVQLWNYTPCQ